MVDQGNARPFEDVKKGEIESIERRRRAVHPEREAIVQGLDTKLVGLALSGGGIRSATFSLGVMQRLAKDGCLDRVDYLSTVSGGGYIGGALTWFANSHPALGTGAGNFPHGVADPRQGRRSRGPGILDHLRLHGKYLTPGKGITATSLVAAILRGVLLNFLVWMPLATAFLVALSALGDSRHDFQWLLSFAALLGKVFLILCIVYSVGIRLPGVKDRCELWRAFEKGIRWVVWLGLATLVLALSRMPLATPLLDELLSIGDGKYEFRWLLLLAALLGGVFLILCIVYSLGARLRGIKRRYELRRVFEKDIRWVLWFGLAALALGSLPALSQTIVSAPSILLGLAGGGLSFLRSGSSAGGRAPLDVIAPAASVLLLYGLLLVAYQLACQLMALPHALPWVLAIGVSVSVVTGWYVNLNYISLHRYYRDRLMEAFMPDPATQGDTAAAKKADCAELAKMSSERAPYHLVNTNVVLVDSDDRRWRVRGGDSFLLSPQYCGSLSTGWVRTDKYMQRDPLTLATAVAISGAAVNPNTGAGGAGPTRKPMLSLLMALLNLRLGYWVPNPRKCPVPQPVASHFRAAWYELYRRGYAEHRDMLQLSDGGHFENLGIYELVRRKVKLIVCCDGAADPDFEFVNLQVLVRRVAEDFGARIEFDRHNRLERLIPREPDSQAVRDCDPATHAYPVGAFAKQGHIKGTITYRDDPDTTTTLILLKTAMIEGLSLLVKGYKAANPAFPDQSTGDQFFDEDQFEAYRELGYEIADRMLVDESVDFCATG